MIMKPTLKDHVIASRLRRGASIDQLARELIIPARKIEEAYDRAIGVNASHRDAATAK
jgi:hypothetical protein